MLSAGTEDAGDLPVITAASRPRPGLSGTPDCGGHWGERLEVASFMSVVCKGMVCPRHKPTAPRDGAE